MTVIAIISILLSLVLATMKKNTLLLSCLTEILIMCVSACGRN
jgi:hypothetical protein